MAKVITKGLIGLEDISVGSGTFTRATSTGGTQILHQVNSSNLGSGFPLQGLIVPTGTVDGVNTAFTLPTTPGSFVMVFRNRLLQISGVSNDYTISGTTITFVTAPLSGDVIWAFY